MTSEEFENLQRKADRKRRKQLPKEKPLDTVKLPKQPNQNEMLFRTEYLSSLLRNGNLVIAEFEGIVFKLYTVQYKPDWKCRRPNGIMVCYEVKPFYKNTGKPHWHPGSRERLKIAASMYPDVEFYGAWREPVEWRTERIASVEMVEWIKHMRQK